MIERERFLSAARLGALLAVALMWPSGPAAAQARGPVIQIPDDEGPGAPPQPAPAPPVVAPPAAGPATTGGDARTACQGAACVPAPNAWHVLNTSNRTCLMLSRNDLKGGKDVRRLSSLLPSPMFVVASGGCP